MKSGSIPIFTFGWEIARETAKDLPFPEGGRMDDFIGLWKRCN
jgi:hypothetical protein